MRFACLVVWLVALAVSTTAHADSCSCSYSGTRSCSASISCPTGEKANCSCTTGGCTATCGAQKITIIPTTEFSQFNFVESGLRGFSEHINQLTQGTWVVQVDASLPDDRISHDYSNVTFSGIVGILATEFGACFEINSQQRVVTFRPVGTCS
jgi:hypothetical protein